MVMDYNHIFMCKSIITRVVMTSRNIFILTIDSVRFERLGSDLYMVTLRWGRNREGPLMIVHIFISMTSFK